MTLGRLGLLATVALVAVVPRMALAADAMDASPMMPTPPMAAPYNWTGSYIGVQGGYGWSGIDVGETHLYQSADTSDEFDDGSPLPPFNYSGSGAIGGGEVGYNWQANSLVFGVVADISAANIHGSYTDDTVGFTSESTINWLGTVRANLGVPVGKLLLYGTGGLAFGGITSDLHDTYPGPLVINSSDSTTAVGWTAGAGIAAALGNNWIVKAEYLYVDLGSHDVTFHETPVGNYGFPLITSSADVNASLVRFSLDYKF